MTLIQAIVLGIVQGLTEFIPVSSTAHQRIVPALLGWHFYNSATGTTTNDPGAAFTAVIQLGTTVAVVLYFWRELVHVLMAWFHGIRDATHRESLEYRMGWYLIIATIPVSVFGLAFSHQIETAARNLWVISTALIVFAIVLYIADRRATLDREEEELNRTDSIIVGSAQALALIPGASRSGTTISAGLFRGLDREAAARFSFLLSIPAVVLSGLYEMRHIGDAGAPGAGLTAIALICAFVVGLASIHWLMRWLAHHNTYRFVYYRIGLGLLVMGLLAGGVLDATS